jgi:hypothetical protein
MVNTLAGRYVLSIASIGAFYTLLQLPFAIYYATKGERLNGCFLDFDFYGDKVLRFFFFLFLSYIL